MSVDFGVDHKRTHEYRIYPEDITILPEMNGRHELPDIEWLIADILRDGQHTAVVIRKDGDKPVLSAGFTRWRAVSAINDRELLGPGVKLRLRCTYMQGKAVDGFLVNISENRARRPTTMVDDAYNIKRLMNVFGKTEEECAQIYFPTAHTPKEIAEAVKFVRERIDLIALSPEAEKAISDGRVKPNAIKAIAKLTNDQQKKALAAKPAGDISAADLALMKPAQSRAPKGVQKDAELMRRLAAVLEDVDGLLTPDNENEFIEVDRVALSNLNEYVNQLKAGNAQPASVAA